MLDYERLDVYQRSIEFLALAFSVAERVPHGYASPADGKVLLVRIVEMLSRMSR
jgi:hypothetical protein